jgi:SAM-dependent methyltransferase
VAADDEMVARMVCPSCRAPLRAHGERTLLCEEEGTRYRREQGIWRMLDPAARRTIEPFLDQYRSVRRAEGWGDDDDDYYRALPFEDRSGRHREIWRVRATSYRAFRRRVLSGATADGPLRTLDLGAGNGWMSAKLAGLGHHVAAVDVNDDAEDGLGAHGRYRQPTPFAVVQASFDRLPWSDGFADLIVYNGSLHYSTDYQVTLREARRLLGARGRVVVLDSPYYRRAQSGAAMIRERDEGFRTAHGTGTESVDNEGYLTLDRLDELGSEIGFEWRVSTPFYGLRWALRPLLNRIRGLREPARFHLVIGRPIGARR